MQRITKENFQDIKVGEVYLMVSPQFNSANHVICISDDYADLNREIKYFAFADRISEVPTAEKFQENMQNNIMTPHTFAVWDFAIESKMIFPLTDSKSHIKFVVSYSIRNVNVIDHYENFDNYAGALKRYNTVLNKDHLFNAILSIALISTD